MPSTQKFSRFNPLFILLSTLSASVSPVPQATVRSSMSVKQSSTPKPPHCRRHHGQAPQALSRPRAPIPCLLAV
ncbi:hypothetical protein BC826DRAFT_1073568, partial [Russula brevipes]